ncbi:MAG: signal peptidase I [Clostridia bacterium]|nr:signal peptidase I [Clostridia bacterium]
MGLYDYDENSDIFEGNETAALTEEKPDDAEEISEVTETAEEIEEVSVIDDTSLAQDPGKKKKRKKKKAKAILKEVLSFVVIIFLAFIIAVLINIYVIRTSHVIGPSMNPTLESGQNVLISRLPYLFDEPRSGDIVVFDSSKSERTFILDVKEALRDNAITRLFVETPVYNTEEQFYIKRVIGVAGDVITVKDGVMYLNNEPLKNDGYSINDDGTAYFAYEGQTWTVEEGYVFVMGDNRINSKDSRKIGCIPVNCIMGKVIKE